MLALLLLQAAASAAAPPERFSILADTCRPVTQDGKDIVVCAKGSTPRLPLPDDAPSSTYIKPDSGDYRDNYAHTGVPCAALQKGCQVGVGPPIVPMIKGAAQLVGDARKERRWAAARKRDGDRRVAIDLDAPPAPGHLEP